MTVHFYAHYSHSSHMYTVTSTLYKNFGRCSANTARLGKRKRVRFSLDISIVLEDAKEAFLISLNDVRYFVTPEGADKLNNYGMLSALFTFVE